MPKKNSDLRFMMKCFYWMATMGMLAFVGYIGWEIFLTVYGGMTSN